MTDITVINKELDIQLSNKEVSASLISTTFKGLQPTVMRQAMLDGMIRGFTFENFLQKDVYAIPFSSGYSLVTSIDWARKQAMRAGMAGKDAPVFQLANDGNVVISCSVTVYKIVDGVRCPFSSLVFFKEYTTGKNLWVSKPMTMIAKVAEMHALRMAFPEDLAKAYVEEEMEKPVVVEVTPKEVNVEENIAILDKVTTLEELKKVWTSLPISVRNNADVLAYKDTLKAKLTA